MIDAAVWRRPSATLRRRAMPLIVTTLLAFVLASPAGARSVTASPAVPASASAMVPASAASTQAMASDVLAWLNRDRVAAGLLPLRSWPAMAALATQRSANLAAGGILSHASAGDDPGTALRAQGLQWYSFGEIIGTSSFPWGSASVANLYSLWKASPHHHDIMFSAAYNYIGVGFTRGPDGSTWSSILFAESADHTPAAAYNGSLTLVKGTSIHFTWSGIDPLLQTHTAGLRSFNVQYRVDSGAWHLIRNDTTMTWLGLSNRARGHYYSFQVQAADRRGNLSAWTPVKRIWLP